MNWRNFALISSAVLVLATLGPWHNTVLGAYSGVKGDGRITSGLGAIAAIAIFESDARSRWQIVAAVLGIAAGLITGIDLINIETANQELFGESVQLVSAGWGLWLSFLASVALAVGAFIYRSEAIASDGREPSELPHGE